MQLHTKYHGIHEYEEKDVITLVKGMPGFERLTKFIVIPIEENEVFSILHSIEDRGIGLTVVSPFMLLENYEFKLSDELIEKLKINNEADVLVLNTVTLNSRIQDITTNLRAPIIINIKEKLGEQIILNDEKFLLKYPLFKENA